MQGSPIIFQRIQNNPESYWTNSMGQITGKQSDTKEYMRSSEKKEATPSSEAAQDTLASGLVPGTLVENITLEKG